MRRVSNTRSALAMAFALAVVTQPLAAGPCHCSNHADAGSMAGAHSDNHGRGEQHGAHHRDADADHAGMMAEHTGSRSDHSRMRLEHAGDMPVYAGAVGSHDGSGAHHTIADECESPDSACQCDACGQGFGPIFQSDETFTSLPAQGAVAPPHYLEPPRSRALRPPIRV